MKYQDLFYHSFYLCYLLLLTSQCLFKFSFFSCPYSYPCPGRGPPVGYRRWKSRQSHIPWRQLQLNECQGTRQDIAGQFPGDFWETPVLLVQGIDFSCPALLKPFFPALNYLTFEVHIVDHFFLIKLKGNINFLYLFKQANKIWMGYCHVVHLKSCLGVILKWKYVYWQIFQLVHVVEIFCLQNNEKLFISFINVTKSNLKKEL